jgi:SEL1 protein
VHYYFAAANGEPFSRMALGYRHQHGLGVPKSCWTAVAYYQPVAEQVVDIAGTPGSLPQIERIRLNVHANQGLKADRHREVLQYYQYSADHGNVDAQTAVGQVLNYGTHGVQRDHATAKHYFQQAAAADDADAMAHLGHMHANGLGAPQDYEAARKLFERAAARSSASGMFGLACLHLNGFGVEVDYARAFKLFSQAMEQGLPDAYYYLGVMHMKGLGVKRKSAQRAFSYFNIAAHAGNLQAMYNTAMMQLGGKGTQRLCKPALALLKEVAEKGRAAVVLQQAHEQFFKGHNTRALLLYLQVGKAGRLRGSSAACACVTVHVVWTWAAPVSDWQSRAHPLQ